jgi:hypothetical protein
MAATPRKDGAFSVRIKSCNVYDVIESLGKEGMSGLASTERDLGQLESNSWRVLFGLI